MIELLVVVSLVGILAVIALSNFSEYKARARDVNRLSMSHNVFTALEGYYSDTLEYPANPLGTAACTPNSEYGGGSYSADCLTEISDFIPTENIAKNMRHSNGDGHNLGEELLYYFNYGPNSPQGAVVKVQLESLSKKSPCVFPTGGLCSQTNIDNFRVYCKCTGS